MEVGGDVGRWDAAYKVTGGVDYEWGEVFSML